MSLSVKLFVKKSGSDEVDLRRISVDEDVSASYEYLLAKIRATVPSASHAPVRLFWEGKSWFKRPRLSPRCLVFLHEI